MTTLRDGTVVDESITAVNFTPAHKCLAAFGYPRRIESITIHHWGLDGQDFDRVVGYLASANARSSSAHATIQAGRAASIVSPDDASWHAGNAYGGATSIGLELRPEATDGDYITAAAYIFMLREIYGDLPLIPHHHWTQTACPGRWDLTKLDLMSRAGIQTNTTEQEVNDMGQLTGVDEKVFADFMQGIRDVVKDEVANIENSVAFQEQFSVKMLERIASQAGLEIDTKAIATEIREELAKQIGT